MLVTIIKMFYKKQRPKTIQYRKYITFKEQFFRIVLDKKLSKFDANNTELPELYNEFLPVLKRKILLYSINMFELIILLI